MPSKIVLLFISLLFSVLLSFLMYRPLTMLKWLDAVFLTGLFLLTAAALMALIEGQFFKVFIDSTKYFFAKINKKEQLIRESERRTENASNYVRSFPARKNIFYIGLLLALGSLTLSVVLFYF